jgi:hypothetical protein
MAKPKPLKVNLKKAVQSVNKAVKPVVAPLKALKIPPPKPLPPPKPIKGAQLHKKTHQVAAAAADVVEAATVEGGGGGGGGGGGESAPESEASKTTSYPYSKFIKAPESLGVSAKGTMSALGSDINGLSQYVQLLVTGTSKASTTGKPLGNKFFAPTSTKCIDVATNNSVDRHLYFSNVPTGSIPYLTDATGASMKNLKGLVPGLMSNAHNISIPDTSQIFQSFQAGLGGGLRCQSVTLEVIDTNNKKTTESRYIALSDIKEMSPCLFRDHKNPVTKKKCVELFSNPKTNNQMEEIFVIPNDAIIQIYFLFFGLFLIYVSLRILFSKQKRLQ